jgi:hypothetical protein
VEFLAAEKIAEAKLLQAKSDQWHVPLSDVVMQLHEALESMDEWKLHQEDIPLIIKLTENPSYRTARCLGGAVDLFTHDCIHALLGRGVLLKDEAFVIGYTMGSSKKINRWRRNLFMFVCKHLYPEGYKFGEQERFVFYSGVMIGSRCQTDLTRIDFSKLADYKIQGIREKLNIDKKVLECYYCAEKKLFPDSVESQRL